MDDPPGKRDTFRGEPSFPGPTTSSYSGAEEMIPVRESCDISINSNDAFAYPHDGFDVAGVTADSGYSSKQPSPRD